MANRDEPTIWDFLKYGRSAPNVARDRFERDRAKDLLPLLAELKQLEQNAPTAPKVETKYNIDLPGADEGFSYQNEVDLARSLNALGIDQGDFTKTLEQGRLTQELDRLSSPEQRVDALNKKSVAPVDVNGGTLYNRYDSQNPQILDESSAVTELARKRGAEAEQTQLRTGALQQLLDDPDTDPLTAASIANNKTTFKPERVKVRNRNGDIVYMDAIPTPGGGYTYRPSADAQGEPLRVPPGSPGAIEKDADLLSSVFGLSKEDATRQALSLRQHLKTETPEDAWAKLVEFTAGKGYGRYLRDPQKLYEKAAEIWQVKFPNRPVPAESTLEGMFNPDAIQGEQTSLPAAAPTPAPAPRQPAATAQIPEEEEVRQRAIADGYDNLGAWIPGRGFEVLNETGEVIGYYY